MALNTNTKVMVACAFGCLAMPLAMPKMVSVALDFGPSRAVLMGTWAYLAGKATNASLPECILAVERNTQARRRANTLSQLCRVIRSTEAATLYTTPYGRYWLPKGERVGMILNFVEREEDIYRTSRIKAGDVVLDCGANIGVFARAALDHGAGKVVAIEPTPRNVECLRQTFAREIEAGRVIVYPKAVWDQESTMTMTVSHVESGVNSLVLPSPSHARTIQVSVTTIDRIVAELGLSSVDFIKLDVEGAERQALRGAANTVARFRPHLAVALEHFPNDAEELPAYLTTLWPGMRTERGPYTLVAVPNLQQIQPEVVWANPRY